MKSIAVIASLLLFATALLSSPAHAAPAGAESAGAAAPNVKSTKSGLRFVDEKIGTGTEATRGKKVSVHYTGWLLETNDVKGKKFDSSLDHGDPFEFNLGAGEVIPGWDEGVQNMKIGGKRTLMIPSQLAYGPNGIPGVIPPGANLVFDVELLAVQ